MSRLLRHMPNLITSLRLAAAPATAALLAAGHFTAAFAVFVLAGLSDAADGFLAKRFNLSSPLGRVLDPAADKALMLAAFVTLALLGAVPEWLAATVVARDVLILSGLAMAMALRAPLAVHPILLGKLSTALQVLYIGWHLAGLAFDWPLGVLSPADAFAVGAATLLSGFGYVSVGLKAMRAVWLQDGRRA